MQKGWRDVIQLNPNGIYPAKLDIDDIFSLIITWCNDQASTKPSLAAKTPTTTASRISTEEFNEVNTLLPNEITAPNYFKGTVEVHYGGDNYVEFVGDSDTMFKYLLCEEDDKIADNDPLFAQLSRFFFSRLVMRVATGLGVYNTLAECMKASVAGNSSAGYYGNAIGDICLLWLYGWGYYVAHGTFYKESLDSADSARKERISLIKDKLKAILGTGAFTTSPLNHKNGVSQTDESSIKPLLEEAMELGAFADSDLLGDKVLENASKFDFNPYNITNHSKSTSSCYEKLKFFCWNTELQSRFSAKTGYYELLDIAAKYLYEQRLYAKKEKNTAVSLFIILLFPLATLGALFGWYANLDIYMSCLKDKLNKEYSCQANKLGMYLQGGYVIFLINLIITFYGIITVFAGLIYGSIEIHNLVQSFIRRFKMLRKVDLKSISNHKLIEAVRDYIERDCYERYILIKTILEKIGKVWSPLQFAILVVDGALILYYYVLILTNGSYFFFAIDMFCLAVWATPTMCNSYANSAMDYLLFSLKSSGPSDYSVIGGRDNFLAFTEKTPLYWYIFGFAITPSWLAGFIGGILSAVVVGAIISKT